MANSRMFEVAEQLLIRAKEGKLVWHGSPGVAAFLVRLDDLTLLIARLSWMPGPPPAPPGLTKLPKLPDLRKVSTYGFRLELLDGTGAVVGKLFSTPGDPEHKVLREIYEIAESGQPDIEGNIDKALEYLKRS
jgi:hypothetical protein